MKKPVDRRSFLKLTGATLAASSAFDFISSKTFAQIDSTPQPKVITPPDKVKLPPTLAPVEGSPDSADLGLPRDRRVGIAIIGLGNISLGQAMPAIVQSKRAKIVALVSGSSEKAKTVAQAYNVPFENIYSYNNLEVISNNPDIKAVYVATPNSTHREFTVRAAQAGKHVLCEKPISTTIADANAMIDACKKANVKLMIAYRQQYEPYNSVIKQLVQNKTYGKPTIYQAHFGQVNGDASQWRSKKAMAGGGPLPDVGIYCLNACRFHTGQEPVEVFGWLQQNQGDKRFVEIEQAVTWQMRFQDGLIAHCSASYNTHQSGSFRYYGDKGWFGLSPAFGYQGAKLELAYEGAETDYYQQPHIAEKNQFVLEFEHFCQAVLENNAVRSPGEEGLRDLRLIHAIYESARIGKPVGV